MTIDEDQYVLSFKAELMDAVLQWCRGASFSEICKVSEQAFNILCSDIDHLFCSSRTSLKAVSYKSSEDCRNSSGK